MIPRGGRKMKSGTKIIFILVLLVLFYSCAKEAVIIPPRWEFEKDAIQLNLKSDPQLNLYRGSPHTLLLCAYSLENPNDFNQLLDEKGGLERLCECVKFAPSVTNTKRMFINPDKEYKELLDRSTGAKYVGIVTGYYQLQKENVVRLFPIPVVDQKKGGTITQKPGILKIDLYLGPQKIQ
jgi:type VI secretion system VasD/TssJ family lipoprotein